MTDETLFESDADAQNQKSQTSGTGSGSDSQVAARYKASPLTLTVFKRENDGNTFHNCQLQRAYTPDDGDTWEYTESMRPRDLRKAARLMQKAADDFDQVRVETPDQ